MRRVKVLLIGQPNVGKSSLLNSIVGPKVIISNYPGTTVEIAQAEKIIDRVKFLFTDTPGIYSISDRSGEEKVTEKALFEEKVDVALIIVDATALERSLYILLQIVEAEIPCILALNFVEEAWKKGIKVDHRELERILGIPVVPINPISKNGLNELLEKLKEIKKESIGFRIKYDEHIEKAIEKISLQLRDSELPKRFIAIRILERDEDFYKFLNSEDVIKKVRKNMSDKYPDFSENIAITRYGTAAFIARKVVRIAHLKKEKSLEEKIDSILLHKIWGPLSTIMIFLITFGILLYLGNLMQATLMDSTKSLSSLLGITGKSVFKFALAQSLKGLAAGISIALPYVFIFYVLLGLFEDAGLLPRFIVNTDRYLRKLGLPGKAFIPLTLGLGCSVPATRATRVLVSEREKFYTASFLSFVPCSSRTAIIMGIVGYYGGVRLAIYVFITLGMAAFLWALAIRGKFVDKREPLLLELPPYRKPLVKNIIVKSWFRMRDFVYIVIPLLILGGILYGILEALNFTYAVVKPLSFITSWLNLPDATIIPLLFGFLQKDLTGAMLVSVLGKGASLPLTSIQIYTFGVAAAIGIPCINAFGMLIKEFGLRKAVILTFVSITYGIVLAGLIQKIFLLL